MITLDISGNSGGITMKFKKYILLLIFILIMYGFLHGIILADNNSVERLIFSTASGIYMLEADSDKPVKISNDFVISKLVVYKGCLYYSTQNTVLKRIDQDGTNAITYTEMKYYPDLEHILFINDNLYFPLLSSFPKDYYCLTDDNLEKLYNGIVEDTIADDSFLYIIGRKNYSDRVLYKIELNQDNENNPEETEYYFSGKYLFFDGEYLYFDDRDSEFVLEAKTPYFNFYELNKSFLYRINKNTFIKEEIPFNGELKKNIFNITIYNNNVFFLSGDIGRSAKGKLFKLSLDDPAIMRIVNNDNIIIYRVYDDYIYYFERINDACYLWKCDLQGNNNTILTKVDLPLFLESEPVFKDNYLFITSADSLCRLNLDGTEKIIISNEYPELYFTMAESIFYQTSNGLYKAVFDGSNSKKISSEKIRDYIVIKHDN